VNGEADIHHHHHWPSSSFFPRMQPIERTDLEIKWHGLQMSGEWKQDGGIRVVPKSKLVPVFPGAEVIMRKRKVELAAEMVTLYKRVKAMTDRKGKGKAIDLGDEVTHVEPSSDLHSDQVDGRYPVARITRASANRARRVTGRSVGIAAIEEMIAFEQRGVELGELPEDFSFNK
jgi:hypothetical protein